MALAAARRLSSHVAHAEVPAERSNAMVALEPAGVVARVAMDVRLTARAGHDVRGAYTREVEVARHRHVRGWRAGARGSVSVAGQGHSSERGHRSAWRV